MVEDGIFVSSIEPGSAASVDDMVTVGDRLLSVSSLCFFLQTLNRSLFQTNPMNMLKSDTCLHLPSQPFCLHLFYWVNAISS